MKIHPLGRHSSALCCCQDLRIILATAEDDSGGAAEKVAMPVTSEAKRVFEALADGGKGDFDISYPYLALRAPRSTNDA